MHRLIALLLSTTLVVLQAADEVRWFTDYKEAVAEATRTKKPLLLDFTGSDWCGWCKKLKKEVFDTAEFKAWATGKVVLVEVDFPRGKPQDAAEKQQNDELAKRFEIQGFPTILILDPSGAKKTGELGYLEGGPKAWTSEADKVLSAK